MLLLSPDQGRREKIYQMDLEREQVVSEWQASVYCVTHTRRIRSTRGFKLRYNTRFALVVNENTEKLRLINMRYVGESTRLWLAGGASRTGWTFP